MIVSGHGRFDNGGEVQAFATGDILFARAGRPHRFTTFSDEFSTWVASYGPEGGEKP